MTSPFDPPPPHCHECDAELDADDFGGHGACYYTGGSCPPGGCDCDAGGPLLCDDCEAEAEEAALKAEADKPHDIFNCDCNDCHDERDLLAAERREA